MRKFWLVLAFLLVLATPVSAAETSRTFLAHYMPWYASKPVSGNWGWHWTMNHFNPEIIDADGQRQIASHHYPLVGPYDSSDPDLLECQVLLMKFAGIDGVIVDWYGTKDFYDYAMVHRNTQALLPHLKRAGLKFAISYEDQTIGHMIRGNALKPEEAVEHGREVMTWLDQNWFTDDSYLKIDGQPVLLIFGPQFFDAQQLQEIQADLTNPPQIYVLPHKTTEPHFPRAFGWPPVTGGKQLTKPKWTKQIRAIHARNPDPSATIAVAFPGFRDIYAEAGLHESYGSIPHRGGQTFIDSLDLAIQTGAPLIQIATWNDYGEGTVIEPTRQHGYRDLEALQLRTEGERLVRPRRSPATDSVVSTQETIFGRLRRCRRSRSSRGTPVQRRDRGCPKADPDSESGHPGGSVVKSPGPDGFSVFEQPLILRIQEMVRHLQRVDVRLTKFHFQAKHLFNYRRQIRPFPAQIMGQRIFAPQRHAVIEAESGNRLAFFVG